MSSFDRVFLGGTIITFDESNPIAEALAIKDGLIAAVGSCKDMEPGIGGDTEVVNLTENQTLLPGFIEAHSHFISAALFKALATDISGYQFKTYDAIRLKMKQVIANTASGEWCLFTGWDVELVSDLPQLSASYLDDSFSPEVNLLVITQNGHSAFANHATLAAAGINDDTPDPPGGSYVRDENGILTGQLLEAPAITEVLNHVPRPSESKLKEAVWLTLKDYSIAGLTTVTELAHFGALASGQMDVILIGLQNEALQLPVRLAYYSIAEEHVEKGKIVKPQVGNERVWQAGYKFFADGSPHSGTSAIKKPFLCNDLTEKLSFPPPPNYGHLNWTDKQLLEQVKPYHDEGYQISIHAHGDRAIDQVLRVYENLGGSSNRRHRIEHMGFASEDQLAKCALLNVAPSMFVSHLYYYGKTFSNDLLGKEYTDNWAPVDIAYKYGCKVSLHQDTPTFPGPPQPLASIKTAVTRTQRDDSTTVYGPIHRISIHQALQAYTTGPAWQLFRENELGRLKVGYHADLVVLSANPYLVDPMKLDDPNMIRVLNTYVDGCCVTQLLECVNKEVGLM